MLRSNCVPVFSVGQELLQQFPKLEKVLNSIKSATNPDALKKIAANYFCKNSNKPDS